MAEWILMDVVSLSYNEHDPSCQTLIVKWYHLMTIQVLFFLPVTTCVFFCPEMDICIQDLQIYGLQFRHHVAWR